MTTDVRYPVTGWWPEPKKVCIRCGGVNDNSLQMLCDTCSEGDALAEELAEMEDWLDQRRTQEDARGVGLQ